MTNHEGAPTLTKAEMAARPRRPAFGVRHLMFAVVVIALILWGVRDLWKILLLFIVTVSPILVACLLVLGLLKRRATQQDALLSVLWIGAEHQLPISEGAQAFADLCSGGYRKRVLAFSYLLDSGVELPETLASIPNLLPPGAASLTCVGWGQARLAAGLREARAAQSSQRSYMPGILGKLGYFIVLMLALQAIGGFILYFIAPKFEAIFADFGVALPAVTRFVIELGNTLLGSLALPAIILLELALLIYVPFSYFGLLRWRLPLTNLVMKRRDVAAVLRGLAITVEAGNPIPTGLALIRDYHAVSSIRRNLGLALILVQEGVPWPEALRRRGLLRGADLAVIESAERAGNLVWALQTLADGAERRLGYRLAALSQFILPLVILGVGTVIGLIAVGYFLPLVELIKRLGG